MSYSPIGDTVAVVKLAYNLYSRFIVVARDAPEQLAGLSNEFLAIKEVLWHVKEQLGRSDDSNYGGAVRATLLSCLETLRGLQQLTAKYENLGEPCDREREAGC